MFTKKPCLAVLLGILLVASCSRNQKASFAETSEFSSLPSGSEASSVKRKSYFTKADLEEVQKGYSADCDLTITTKQGRVRSYQLVSFDVYTLGHEYALTSYPVQSFDKEAEIKPNREHVDSYIDYKEGSDGALLQRYLTIDNVLHEEKAYSSQGRPISYSYAGYGNAFESLNFADFERDEKSDNVYHLDSSYMEESQTSLLTFRLTSGYSTFYDVTLSSFSLLVDEEGIYGYEAEMKGTNNSSTIIFSLSATLQAKGEKEEISSHFVKPLEGEEDTALKNAFASLNNGFEEHTVLYTAKEEGSYFSSPDEPKEEDKKFDSAYDVAMVSDYLLKDTYDKEDFSEDGFQGRNVFFRPDAKENSYQQFTKIKDKYYPILSSGLDPIHVPSYALSSLFFTKSGSRYVFEHDKHPEVHFNTTSISTLGENENIQKLTIELKEKETSLEALTESYSSEAWTKSTYQITLTPTTYKPSDFELPESISSIEKNGDSLSWSDFPFLDTSNRNMSYSDYAYELGGEEVLKDLPVIGDVYNSCNIIAGVREDNDKNRNAMQYCVYVATEYEKAWTILTEKAKNMKGWTFTDTTEPGYLPHADLTYGTAIQRGNKAYTLTVSCFVARDGYLIMEPMLEEKSASEESK